MNLIELVRMEGYQLVIDDNAADHPDALGLPQRDELCAQACKGNVIRMRSGLRELDAFYAVSHEIAEDRCDFSGHTQRLWREQLKHLVPVVLQTGGFQMNAQALKNIDAHEIIPGLWQGSAPQEGDLVARAGFDLLVLCASGYQPAADAFPGVGVIHAPFDDHTLSVDARGTARRAARMVASNLKAGRKVLVTCVAGINRSGLVTALAIHERLGYSGKACVELVRGKRWVGNLGMALSNRHFVAFLERLESR